jgi:hypothetical protein
MTMKVKIKNKSSREIPQELVDAVPFKSFDEVNRIADEYNLRITELSNGYENGKLVEQELTFGDSYAKEN